MNTKNTQEKTGSLTHGLGITGLILGIITLVVSFIPCFGMLAVFIGILGLIISFIALAIALKHKYSKGLIIAALSTSILGCSIAYFQKIAMENAIKDLTKDVENTLDDLTKNTDQFKKEQKEIDTKFITLNSIQIGDNIKEHNNFVLSNDDESYFDIYTSKDEITINKLKGELKLFVLNSKIEKIEFISGATFMGSTSGAGIIFKRMLEERKKWVRDAMLNYNISEWDTSKKTPQYTKQGFLHTYNLEKIQMLGTQMGWYVSYIITSKNAMTKEEQGKIDNLDFGSTKEKKRI